MEGFILELSLEVGHLQRAIEDLERHEDIYNDAFMACQYDRLIHAKDALIEVRDALKENIIND